MKNFNKKNAKIFALVHLGITVFLTILGVISSHLDPDTLASNNGLLNSYILLFYAYAVAIYTALDIPISLVLNFVLGHFGDHISVGLGSWQVMFFCYGIFGTAWWYFLGGCLTMIFRIFSRKKN